MALPMIETIIKIKVTCYDEEITETDSEELTEFIIDTLNNDFQKDFLEFERWNKNWLSIHMKKQMKDLSYTSRNY
jgi:hypothetical protein